jgi:hypothetical protein
MIFAIVPPFLQLRSAGPHEDVAYAEPHENAKCRFVKTDSAKRALQLRFATFVGKYAKVTLNQYVKDLYAFYIIFV